MSAFPVQFLSPALSVAQGASAGRDSDAMAGEGDNFDAALAAQQGEDEAGVAPPPPAPEGAAAPVLPSDAAWTDLLTRAADGLAPPVAVARGAAQLDGRAEGPVAADAVATSPDAARAVTPEAAASPIASVSPIAGASPIASPIAAAPAIPTSPVDLSSDGSPPPAAGASDQTALAWRETGAAAVRRGGAQASETPVKIALAPPIMTSPRADRARPGAPSGPIAEAKAAPSTRPTEKSAPASADGRAETLAVSPALAPIPAAASSAPGAPAPQILSPVPPEMARPAPLAPSSVDSSATVAAAVPKPVPSRAVDDAATSDAFGAMAAQNACADVAAVLNAGLGGARTSSPPLAVAPENAKVKVSVVGQRAFLPPVAAASSEPWRSREAWGATDSGPMTEPWRARDSRASGENWRPAETALPPGDARDAGVRLAAATAGLVAGEAAPSASGARTGADRELHGRVTESRASAADAAAATTPTGAGVASTASPAPAIAPSGAGLVDVSAAKKASTGTVAAPPSREAPPAAALRRDLDVALEPAELGGLAVRLKSRGDRLEIAFVAQREATARLIDSGGARLESQLREAGLGSGGLEVTVASAAAAGLPAAAASTAFSGDGGFSAPSNQSGAQSGQGSRQNSADGSYREQSHDAGEQAVNPGPSPGDRGLYL